MSLPSIAIIILNYNGKNHLAQFLPSVMATAYSNKRIIIADNASTDDSLSFLENNFSETELIIIDKNYGYAGGYNKSLKQVIEEY